MKYILMMLALVTLAGCDNDARVASSNLSRAADNFEITRRIVFYNGITGGYMLSLEGRCSFDASTGRKLENRVAEGGKSV